MKAAIMKNLITAILLAATPSCLWGADLNVLGNVKVQGDGTASSPGNLTVNGDLSSKSIRADGNVGATGNLSVSGTLTTDRNAFGFLAYYYLELYEGDDSEESCDLGAWDLCILSQVGITGQDDHSSDVGQCKVTVSDSIKNTALTARPRWQLWIHLGSEVDNVRCAAICLSFASNCTGDCNAYCRKG